MWVGNKVREVVLLVCIRGALSRVFLCADMRCRNGIGTGCALRAGGGRNGGAAAGRVPPGIR